MFAVWLLAEVGWRERVPCAVPGPPCVALRGCGCGACVCLASGCLLRGSDQLLLVFAFLRTTDHPRRVSRCAVGTAAMGDPTGARDLSVPLVLVAQHPTVQRETLAAFNDGGPWGLSRPCACVCARMRMDLCVRVWMCACTWTCVCMLCCRSEGKGSLLSGVWGTR